MTANCRSRNIASAGLTLAIAPPAAAQASFDVDRAEAIGLPESHSHYHTAG